MVLGRLQIACIGDYRDQPEIVKFHSCTRHHRIDHPNHYLFHLLSEKITSFRSVSLVGRALVL